ncbi:hypothetical protein P153DRAFT_355590 [Dothidotthia symphoricarpi CBS 119687]|uniref:Uncharacterized protein n=1 Tax=Dothidotthia symphoricarpi CBS 119687 TaxID=1392245 RepID=A0A6A6AFJ4_9PLEO|nr:uncharacterized protein P153DRAFT_355590 [Dothidotthia symphoricarpi CBS 119687]KAF2130742.1 hypothetical protein P153DRAFT_355590 [Dothidotthia symphoricarpi CBS 119687]
MALYQDSHRTLQTAVERGCEIVQDYMSRDEHHVQYKKGMQGHYLGEQTNKSGSVWAKIFILVLKLGDSWKENIEDWDIDASLVPNANKTRWQEAPHIGDTQLEHTIVMLLQAFIDTPASFLGWKLPEAISKNGIADFASVIITGIKAAGVFEALNNPEFTSLELRDAARFQIDNNSGGDKKGIYARFQKSQHPIVYWIPNTWLVHSSRDIVTCA